METTRRAHNPGGFQTGNNCQRQCEILPSFYLLMFSCGWSSSRLHGWGVVIRCRLPVPSRGSGAIRNSTTVAGHFIQGAMTQFWHSNVLFFFPNNLEYFFFSDTPNNFNSAVWKISIFRIDRYSAFHPKSEPCLPFSPYVKPMSIFSCMASTVGVYSDYFQLVWLGTYTCNGLDFKSVYNIRRV